MNKATIDKIYSWADKRRKKYNNEYQQSGCASSLRTYERYDDICEICGAAERGSAEEDEMRLRIHKNQQAVLNQFDDMMSVSRGKTFSDNEVREWMRRMMV